MHIDPALWPAIIGATLGLPLLVLWTDHIQRRWKGWPKRVRSAHAIALGVFALLYGSCFYAFFIEPATLVVRRVEVVSAHWQGAPLTIAAIGDTHVGSPHVSAARVQAIVLKVNSLRPDLVVLLGDYVGGHAAESERTDANRADILGGVATFAALNAPLGVVGVLGNHDVWYGRASITQAMENAGVGTLWNRNLVITRPGGDFVVAGLADFTTGDPDFAAALDGAPDIDTLVISHSPDPFEAAPTRVALMLAGRGHCGQVTIPLIGRPIVPLRNRKYECHRTDENGHTLYETAGIGTSFVPVRFLNPPEIVLITIRSASQGFLPAPTREQEQGPRTAPS